MTNVHFKRDNMIVGLCQAVNFLSTPGLLSSTLICAKTNCAGIDGLERLPGLAGPAARTPGVSMKLSAGQPSRLLDTGTVWTVSAFLGALGFGYGIRVAKPILGIKWGFPPTD